MTMDQHSFPSLLDSIDRSDDNWPVTQHRLIFVCRIVHRNSVLFDARDIDERNASRGIDNQPDVMFAHKLWILRIRFAADP